MDTIQELIKKIEQGTHQNLIIVEADQSYLSDQIKDAMILKKFGPSKKINPLEWETYNAESTPLQQVIQSLRTLPFLANSKTVLLKNAESLKNNDLEELLNYAQKPSSSNILLLFINKIDARKSIWKKILNHASAASAAPPKDYKLPEWIAAEAQKRKLKISTDATQYIASAIGSNLNMIDQALNKLQLAFPNQKTIELQDASNVVEEVKQRTVFELTDAISAQNLHQQLKILDSLLEQKESPVMINATIAKHISTLMQVKQALSKNTKTDDIIQALKMHPFVFKKAKQAAQNFTSTQLQKFHADTYHTDKKLKSSKIPSLIILQNLLISNAPPKSSSRR